METSPGRRATFVHGHKEGVHFDHNVYWPANARVAARGDHDIFAAPAFFDVSGPATLGDFSEHYWDFRMRERARK